MGTVIYLVHTSPHRYCIVTVISQYLKGLTGWALPFKCQGKFTLDIYNDSNFSKFLVAFKSTTRYCTFLERELITWRSGIC